MADGPSSKQRLTDAATDLFRRRGFNATSVDDICTHAGLSKGAFFHHFESKEAVALACLRAWDEMAAGMIASAAGKGADPVEGVLATMDYLIGRFSRAETIRSCLAGTAAQEVWQTHPAIRDGANACLTHSRERFEQLIGDAARHAGVTCDSLALATLWTTTLQGALLIFKASGDSDIFRLSLGQVRTHVESILRPRGEGDRTAHI